MGDFSPVSLLIIERVVVDVAMMDRAKEVQLKEENKVLAKFIEISKYKKKVL